MLIFFGILSIVFGGFLCANGNAINNDLDAQMESIFNDGIANPGSTYQTVGITLFVIGFVLLFVGLIIYNNKKQEQKDEEDKVLYCSIHLSPLPWYKRLINGIKYIFGYRCKYGDFDEFLFDEKHIDKLNQMVNFLNENEQ